MPEVSVGTPAIQDTSEPLRNTGIEVEPGQFSDDCRCLARYRHTSLGPVPAFTGITTENVVPRRLPLVLERTWIEPLCFSMIFLHTHSPRPEPVACLVVKRGSTRGVHCQDAPVPFLSFPEISDLRIICPQFKLGWEDPRQLAISKGRNTTPPKHKIQAAFAAWKLNRQSALGYLQAQTALPLPMYCANVQACGRNPSSTEVPPVASGAGRKGASVVTKVPEVGCCR